MKLKPIISQNQRRGFTLTEFAIVLGIIGAVLASIWAMASNISNNVRQENFSNMLTTIVGNVRGHVVGRPSFNIPLAPANNVMTTLKNMNVFPGEMVRAGIAGVDTPFALNSLVVCGWAATGQVNCAGAAADVPLFAVELQLPATNDGRRDCVGAALRNSNPATLPGLVALFINGVSQAFPLAANAANAACGNAGAKTIDFVYRLTQ